MCFRSSAHLFFERKCCYFCSYCNSYYKHVSLNRCFSSHFQTCHLKPLLRKNRLTLKNLKNYRPVANIKFLSKLVEKHVVNNINDHMCANNLGEDYQSAYCSALSTETALLKVKNDIMCTIHDQKAVFLVLLDLSAAFDTVSQSILFERLESEIGVTGTALDWFRSYFSGRTTRVLIENTYSEPQDMCYGLPQGSIVGPTCFTIYTIPIGRIIKKHNLSYHFYADDIQIYISFTPTDSSSVQTALNALTNCINEIRFWMSDNMLKLNNDKTEFVVAFSPHFKRRMPNVHLKVGDDVIKPSRTIRNLGIIFDDLMSMSPQITSLSRSSTYHLRSITRIRSFLDFDSCNSIVRSLILSRLDYGNALLLGANSTDLNRLQHFQNWAAKLIFSASKFDYASPFLKELHWLPVKERIQYKILLYVFKCLNGQAPSISCHVSLCISSLARTSFGFIQNPAFHTHLKSYCSSFRC